MTGPPQQRPQPPRRRLTDIGPEDSARARQGRLVRFIAADPDLVGWLGTTKARTLHEVAVRLTELGHSAAAEVVHHYADDLANGQRSPF